MSANGWPDGPLNGGMPRDLKPLDSSVHTHIQAHLHTCTQAHLHTCTRTRAMQTCTHAYTWMYTVCIYAHVCMYTYVCVSVHMWALLGTPPTQARERIGAHVMARRRQRRVGDDEGAGLERFPSLFLHFAPRGPQALTVNMSLNA